MAGFTNAELLTVDETAGLLKVNAQTVRNWIDRGELPALRVGGRRVRIQRSVLEAFIGYERDSADADTPVGTHTEALSGPQRDAAASLIDEIAANLAQLAAILRNQDEG